MIVIGGLAAVFILIAMAIAKGESAKPRAATRDQLAASLLYHVLIAGGVTARDAMRTVRGSVVAGIDITSWASAYAQTSSEGACERLLETAVQLAIARRDPIPLRQYAALLDLSFGLGFHSDALARLRERYGFEYVDHAKDGRPREADRVPLFQSDRTEWLRVLELEGTPDRPAIIAAYRRLAALHHPDKFHAQSEEIQRAEAARFIEITRAYEKLLGSGL